MVETEVFFTYYSDNQSESVLNDLMKKYYRLPNSSEVGLAVNKKVDSIECATGGRLNTLRVLSEQMGLVGQVWRCARLNNAPHEDDTRDPRYSDLQRTAAQVVIPTLVTVLFMAGVSNGDKGYGLQVRPQEPELGDDLNAEEFLKYNLPDSDMFDPNYTPHLAGVKMLAEGAVSLIHPYARAQGKTPAQLHLQAMRHIYEGQLPSLTLADLPLESQ